LFAARGFILGLVILGLVVFAFLSLLAFARGTRTGVKDRYRYAGQIERRGVGEVEGDIRPNDGANVDPGWEFRNPNQNRLGGSAAVRAPDDG
jgi:hypothetical protein